MTHSRLAGQVDRIVSRADRDAVRRRRERQADREFSIWDGGDGLTEVSYLTLPPGSDANGDGVPDHPVPMVLLVHGGPWGRDEYGYNGLHQWLANRGYAVLSVNYRGSTGFGKAFVTAADKEWGGKMHDDLIDAVDWAVGQGIADPKRVGFFGGSYGGYSALTAATKTPEVFACIVDVFGISNLITFMATIPPYWGSVVQHLEEPARRSGDRSRPRLPDRALAADAYRPRGASDPDRARHAGRAGGRRRIRADGGGAEETGRAGHLHHLCR